MSRQNEHTPLPEPIQYILDKLDRITDLEEERATLRRRCADLEEALRGLVEIIDAAGIRNLSDGVQLGPMSWLVKANGAMETARAALSPTPGQEVAKDE